MEILGEFPSFKILQGRQFEGTDTRKKDVIIISGKHQIFECSLAKESSVKSWKSLRNVLKQLDPFVYICQSLSCSSEVSSPAQSSRQERQPDKHQAR